MTDRLPDSLDDFVEEADQRDELVCRGCGDAVDRRRLVEGRCPGCRYRQDGPGASAPIQRGEQQ